MNEVFDRARVHGFLHNDRGIMRNGDGEEVILRGWGVGNWDNPEGFMLGVQSEFAPFTPGRYSPMGRMDRGRSMDLILRETCGTRYTEEFWKRWRRAYLTEADIRLMAQRGYNSVRLPIRAWSFLYEEPGIAFNEDSFAMLDDVLSWCEKYRVYAIIDIHAATAAQSCLPCDDGQDNCPHFFEDEESMARMHILMEEFMRRYKDRWIIGGYDVMNEPLSMTPRMLEFIPALVQFYKDMMRRCRVIDKNHMFLLNGTQFSSVTWMLDEDFDPECENWGLSIHAYSMVSPEELSVSDTLKLCKKRGIALWMGETGSYREHAWQTTMYEILREYHAGYNLWSWKTVEEANCASVLNFKLPEEWEWITNYALRGGPRPSFEHAQKIWDAYLENLSVARCSENTVYHPYLLRAGDFEIPAIGYDALPRDAHNGMAEMPGSIDYRVFDRFDLVYEKGFRPPVGGPGGFGGPGIHIRDHVHLRLKAGEFASYTVLENGAYTVGASYCAEADAQVRVTKNGKVLFEGTLPAAEEVVVEGMHPLFAGEPAPNVLPVFTFGTAEGEGTVKLEVTAGAADFGEIVIRKV